MKRTPLAHQRRSAIIVPAASFSDNAALRASSIAGALCTIVEIEGSFSRRLGAQLAILPSGQMVGSMADGCLEAALSAHAARGGKPQIVRYGGNDAAIDERLPCGSSLTICVEPEPDRTALRECVELLDRREVATLAAGCGGTRRYIPELRIVAIGTGPELVALHRQAAAFGAEVIALAPHGKGLGGGGGGGLSLGQVPDIALDPWTAVLVLFHDHEWERTLLPWALASQCFYIGAQGGQETRRARMAFLKQQGFDTPASRMDRLHGPVGIIAHARDPQVLALSALAQIVACYEALPR
ncbi:XdhC family protein [Croceicoccus sp. F390]|uniref:XdhC family protein n=1 Tax=Croceicoccus esteveae TaxID=3075597 RepID=A0ABU2ZGK5_9SPHN|nr:XdhC family protein [Croceicoccus sp. F390]MDT0575449.1 XdhC family protein [Croceicoccus sp. F390]